MLRTKSKSIYFRETIHEEKTTFIRRNVSETRKTRKFPNFFLGLIAFLQKRLKKVEIEGKEHYYYTCGQPHERYNQIWKSFPNLWNYTDKKGFDFYAVKDLIDEFFFRELFCDCEILAGAGGKEVRQSKLEKSGVYFGEPGRTEISVL